MIKSGQALALEVVASWTPRHGCFESAEFARAVVTKLAPAGPPRARALLLACSALCEWGLRIGLEATERSLFHEAVIERHIATAMDKATPASRRTRRANLRFVARGLGLALRAEPAPIARDGPAAPYSFAEIEELKNLLILRHVDAGSWDWNWALKQFEINRHDLHRKKRRRVGFGEVEPLLAVNGHGR